MIVIFRDVAPIPIVPVDALLESDTNNVVVLLPLVKDVPFKMKSFAVMVRGLFVVDNVFEAASVKSPDPSSSLSVSINVVPFVVTFWLRVTPESALSVNPAVNADALFENVIVLFVSKITVVDIFAVFAVTKLFTVMLPVPDEAPIVNVEAVIRPNSALAILIFPEVSPTPIVPVDALLESDTNNVVVLLPLVKEPDNKMSFAVI